MLDSVLLTELAHPDADGLTKQDCLYRRLKAAILSGRLPGGLRLPGTRQLAADLAMGRNGVIHAYQQLIADGFLLADRGGTRVAKALSSLSLATPVGIAAAAARPALSARTRELTQRADATSTMLPFAPGVPDLSAFPRKEWARALQAAWQRVNARQLAYAEPGGEPVLRENIARYLAARRGVRCSPAQVFIVAGGQVALDACARLLADPGEYVWLETPGYPAARNAMVAAGLKPVAVSVDGEGMAPPAELWKQKPPRLIYLTPSHQYPMGSVLSLARRLDFLQKSASTAAWLIEDDYDCEFQHGRAGGRPLPAMQGLQPEAPVIYVGTFSKLLYPGLRIAYMVVPPWAARELGEGIQALYRGGQALEQAALADLIERGVLTRHERRMAPVYRERQRVLRNELVQRFGEAGRVSGGDAGLHLTLHLPEGPPDTLIASEAAKFGLILRPLSQYCSDGPVLNGLVLGYGMAETTQIPHLVERLQRAVSQARGA